MSKAVTLIVPVYKGMPYLEQTIEAIRDLEGRDLLQCLIINDGTPDDETQDYLKTIKDPFITVWDKKNTGLCDSLNQAIGRVVTPYVARCDQDDICVPERIQRQLKVMNETGCDLCFSNVYKISEKVVWKNKDKQPAKTGSIEEFDPWKHGCLLHSTMMAKTDVLRKLQYRAAYYPCDDWDLELRAKSNDLDIRVIGEPLVYYRFHEEANTLRLFGEMQDKRRWAEDSYERRLRKQDELSFEDYLERQNKSGFKKLNRMRKDYHKLCFRLAGQKYMAGKKGLAAYRLILAFISAPELGLKRFTNLIKNR